MTKQSKIIRGSIVALVTPMNPDGSIDYSAFNNLLRMQIESGTAAVVIGGTTGEASTLSMTEQADVISAAVRFCAGKIDVIAGIGANSTSEAIDLAQMAKASGAHSGLAVVPYYVRPNQLGIAKHFEAVAQATSFPQILYNIPGRTGADMQDSTILELAQNPLMIGLKDATSDMARAASFIASAPENFGCYSGDDSTTLAYMLLGGHGTISVVANMLPGTVAKMCAFALNGNLDEARKLNTLLIPIYKALSLDTNPIPIKYAMSYLKLVSNALRLPLVTLDEQCSAQMVTTIKNTAKGLQELSNLLEASGAGNF